MKFFNCRDNKIGFELGPHTMVQSGGRKGLGIQSADSPPSAAAAIPVYYCLVHLQYVLE